MDARELHLSVDLPAGLGLSIVSRRPAEELIFSRFAGITLDFVDTPASKSLDLSVHDVQIDNQLFEAQCTSVLYISRYELDYFNLSPFDCQREALICRNCIFCIAIDLFGNQW